MAKSKRQRRAQSTATSAAARMASSASAAGSVSTKEREAVTPGASAAKAPTSATNGATNGASRLGEIRARTATARPPQRKRYERRLPWWRRNLAAISTVGLVVALIIGFKIAADRRNVATAVNIGDPAPQSVLSALSGVSAQTATTVGGGGAQIGIQGTPPNTPVLTSKGLPEVVYVGAEYCPYCAADRWATVIALDRFGSFKGLTLMKSSSTDTDPNTNTLSFKGATYTSKYITFSATETQDRNQQPLDTPPADAVQSFSTYDTAPYTPSTGGIPFLSFADQYVTTQAPYDPKVLANLSWQQIASDLKDPNSPVTKAIVGTANYQTAAICKVTNNQPANVCSAPYIQQIEASLPAR